jgi:hypothetical protein
MNGKAGVFSEDGGLISHRRCRLNTGLAKVAVQRSADTFVVNQNLVLRINICGENRHLRQARNRQVVKKLKNFKILVQKPSLRLA